MRACVKLCLLNALMHENFIILLSYMFLLLFLVCLYHKENYCRVILLHELLICYQVITYSCCRNSLRIIFH